MTSVRRNAFTRWAPHHGVLLLWFAAMGLAIFPIAGMLMWSSSLRTSDFDKQRGDSSTNTPPISVKSALSLEDRLIVDANDNGGNVLSTAASPQTPLSSKFIALIPPQPDQSLRELVLHLTAPISNITNTLTHNSSIPADQEEVYSPLKNCPVTTQIRIEQLPSSNSQDRRWRLLSLDSQGWPKKVGGDEFYITYRDNNNGDFRSTSSYEQSNTSTPTAVALITDLHNGTYLLDFVSVPSSSLDHTQGVHELSGRGKLTVYFIYTCGIGDAYQPIKDHWRTGGATRVRHSTVDVFAPPIRPFRIPEGDLSSFDRIISFGDSLLRSFVQVGPPRRRYHRPVFSYNNNPRMVLRQSTLSQWKALLMKWHDSQLLDTSYRKALLLGSSGWDVLVADNLQGPHFEDHLEACRRYVRFVQERYPNVTVFWKSPAPIHMHNAHPDCWGPHQECVKQLRYGSNSRALFLHHRQSEIMKELQVSVLDTFEGLYLSAHHYEPGEAIHHSGEFSKVVSNWFFKA